MRLLLVSHIFLPVARAGVETYVHELARALSGRCEVAVATTRKIISRTTGEVRENSLAGLRIFEAVNNLDHEDFRGTYRNEPMERAFATILDRFRPDVVHFNHLLYWSLGLPELARRRGIRVFLTLHDFWLICPRLGQLVDHEGRLCRLPALERCAPCLENFAWGQPPAARRWIRRLGLVRRVTGIPLDGLLRRLQALRAKAAPAVLAAAPLPADAERWRPLLAERAEAVRAMARALDGLLTPSRSLLQRMRDWGLPAERARVLPQGRRPEALAGVAGRRRPGRRLRAAVIGTIAPHKGVLELVTAARPLIGADLSLEVIGPGHQHAAYLERCRAAAGDRIRFRGPVAPTELPRIYEEIDLLCVPSLWDECCPLTIQEAFMAGVPVLASDLGGMRDLLEPGGGRLLEPGEIAAWRAELQALRDDRARLEGYRAAIPAVPTMTEHAERLLALYGGGA